MWVVFINPRRKRASILEAGHGYNYDRRSQSIFEGIYGRIVTPCGPATVSKSFYLLDNWHTHLCVSNSEHMGQVWFFRACNRLLFRHRTLLVGIRFDCVSPRPNARFHLYAYHIAVEMVEALPGSLPERASSCLISLTSCLFEDTVDNSRHL